MPGRVRDLWTRLEEDPFWGRVGRSDSTVILYQSNERRRRGRTNQIAGGERH